MQGLILQVITPGNVNGDETVNIFDLVIVAGNFSKSLVFAPSVTAEIELSTDQKHHIAHAIDKLESNPNRSMAEKMALNVLKLAYQKDYQLELNSQPIIPIHLIQKLGFPSNQLKIHKSLLKSMM